MSLEFSFHLFAAIKHQQSVKQGWLAVLAAMQIGPFDVEPTTQGRTVRVYVCVFGGGWGGISNQEMVLTRAHVSKIKTRAKNRVD